MTTRQLMINNIKAYNNALNDDKLKTKSNIQLLNNCHPIDQTDYARLLLKERKISEADFKKYNAYNKLY